jgi:hypothetical protein
MSDRLSPEREAEIRVWCLHGDRVLRQDFKQANGCYEAALIGLRELLTELDRVRAELTDFSGRVNELESQLCECEPVREHRDLRRPAFYQHAADCPVNGGA